MARDRRIDRQLLPRYAVLLGAAGKREVVKPSNDFCTFIEQLLFFLLYLFRRFSKGNDRPDRFASVILTSVFWLPYLKENVLFIIMLRQPLDK